MRLYRTDAVQLKFEWDEEFYYKSSRFTLYSPDCICDMRNISGMSWGSAKYEEENYTQLELAL